MTGKQRKRKVGHIAGVGLPDPSPEVLEWLRENTDAQWRQSLLQAGELLSERAICAAMNISKAELIRRVTLGAMFSITVDDVTFYPGIFLDRTFSQSKLREVCRILGVMDGAGKWFFLMQPRVSLGGLSPIAALRLGRYGDVRRSARAYVER
ncbi:MAG: hypothetical protein WCA85_14525 [Paraburkholderia sp.]|uniref:hypothetical protein n=1 Tax=Paraburkholderia sp. TaxID=1926495 RepID=UPI003C505B2A